MTKFRSLALFAGTALLPLVLAAGAHAQSYSRLISFGDSLSDNGNLYTATGGTTPPAPYNRRFTNDMVWAEYLSGTMQGFFTATSYTTGNYNAAFGGARSDTVVASPPGTPVQIAAYLGNGGTFGANDVASIWAGANDIFQALPGAASNPLTASTVMGGVATTAAGNVTTQVNQLATAGAKTIVVMNLPDLGKTPQFSADPSASALTSLTTTIFNSALNTGLGNAATAHADTNIVQVDIYSAFGAVIRNPERFGLTDVTRACVNVTACVTGSQDVRNANLFWDGVHPTATGHKLVAGLTAQHLYTPTLTEGVGMLADQSYELRRSNANDLAGRMAGSHGYFVEVVGAQGSRDKDIALQGQIGTTATLTSQKAYDYSLGGFRAGAVAPMGENTSFGIAGTALTGDAKAFMVEARPTDISVDAGITWHGDKVFVSAMAGFGLGSYSAYKRGMLVQGFEGHRNQIDSQSWSGGLQAGWTSEMGGWSMTPLARVSYNSATMSGFSEMGDVAIVKFEDRTVSATSGAVELHTSGKVGALAINGLVGYEAVLSGDQGELRGKLLNNTARAFATDMGEVGTPGLLVGLGVATDLGGFKVRAQYSGNFGDNQTGQQGMISFNKAF
ncbi:esterase estA [Asticcacaulis biprosthecium C19]|uniref:Esterase estA n=1 Tax=Asticcacaulis biprosthecium C19 TaxID=715226 RepID=F4QNH8_9CAUL|nr:autotransporter domain-containing esterase [Asticcacaulis biprosthecium]EGF90886.1 esterase estA [Asticcacaulis biprosthecium C19]